MKGDEIFNITVFIIQTKLQVFTKKRGFCKPW